LVKILVCDKISEEGLKILEENGFQVDVKLNLTKEQLKEEARSYEALIVRSRTKVTREILENAEELRLVVRAGVGLDNIDLEAARERGVTVVNTPEAVSSSVAELAVGLMLAVARSIAEADRTVKGGGWSKERFVGLRLKGKVLGILGLGRIGCEVARVGRALGMKVIFYDVVARDEIAKEIGCEPVESLETLLANSDIISIHIPLTAETRYLIGEKELSKVKPGAILINTARGAIIDEKALYWALKSGKLGGAGIDVYEEEPPKNRDLLKLSNVVCTPHIGAQTKEAQKEASTVAAQKIVEFFKGKV
jgi:D-3-phosphoglycerate dehydrogenase